MLDSLEYRIAKGRIESYEHSTDEVVRASHQAQDCLDCERFLDQGIRACQALEILEVVVRDAIMDGHLEPTPEVKALVHALFAVWQRQSERAQGWIERHIANGYEIRNLTEFRDCCERIEDWLERTDWLSRAAKTRQRLAEELW